MVDAPYVLSFTATNIPPASARRRNFVKLQAGIRDSMKKGEKTGGYAYMNWDVPNTPEKKSCKF